MSELRTDTITASDGTSPVTLTGQTAAKAWVNFNGTGTVAIRESANASSITDNGSGDYTVNFTTAITDANYTMTALGSWDSGSYIGLPIIEWNAGSRLQTKSTTASGIRTWHPINELYYDADETQVAIFR